MINKYKEMLNNNSFQKIRSKLVVTYFGIYTFLMFSTLLYAYWIPKYGVFFGIIQKVASIVLILGCFESLILKKPNSSYLIYILLIVLGILVKYFSTIAFPLWFFVTLFMINGVDFRKIVKTFFYVNGILTLITVFLGFLGLIPTFSAPRGISSDGTVLLRQSLGFNWVTLSSQLFFYLVLCYIFLKKGNLTLKPLIIIFIVSIFLYEETNTRNAFILEILIVLIFGLMNTNLNSKVLKLVKSKFMGILAVIIFPIATFVSILMAFIGNKGPLMIKLDSLMSGRINLSHIGLEKYGISMFGTKITYNTYSTTHVLKGLYFYLDNSYVQYWLNFGTVFILVLIFLITITLFCEYKQKKWYILLIFIFIALHSLGDPQLIYLQYSPFALIIGSVIDKFKFWKND